MGLLIEIAIFVTKTLLGLLNKYKTWRKCFFCRSDIFIFRYRTHDILEIQDMKPAMMFYFNVTDIQI